MKDTRKLPIEVHLDDENFVASVKKGERAIHPDFTSFLANADKAIIVQRGKEYGEYAGETIGNYAIIYSDSRHPQRTLFHELTHTLNNELNLSESRGFIAAYDADEKLAYDNGIYETEFLTHVNPYDRAAQREEVLAFCTEWQSKQGEAPQKNEPDNYQKTYPNCWKWVAENAPSIDHGFAGLVERWGKPNSPLMPALRFIVEHTGDGKWPNKVDAQDASHSLNCRARVLNFLRKVEHVIDDVIVPSLRDPGTLAVGLKCVAVVIVPALVINAISAHHMLPKSDGLQTVDALAAFVGVMSTISSVGEESRQARGDESKRRVFAKANVSPAIGST